MKLIRLKYKNLIRLLLAFVMLFCINKISKSQNNTPCGGSGAPALTLATTCSYTTGSIGGGDSYQSNAANFGAVSCASSGEDVWYSFTVPASGNITVTTQANGITDGVMEIYESDCSTYTSLGCSDDVNGNMPELTLTGLTVGQTHYIRFWEYGGGTGSFDICVIDDGGGGGGGCTADMTINTTTSSNSGLTTCGFGDDYDSGDACGSSYMGGDDIVIAYTPTTTECVDITLTNTDTWTGVFILDDCPDQGGASCLSSNTNSAGNPSISSFNVTAGTTYYIVVSTFPSPQCTAFDLDIIACPPAPANDLCADATSLDCGDSFTNETTVNSTSLTSGTGCGSDYGVWYTFVGDGDQTTITVTNSYDIDLSISSGSCGTFTSVVCSDTPENHTFITTNGLTYYIYISYYSAFSTNTGTFDISRTCTTVTPPANDDCDDAIALTINTDLTCTSITAGTVEFATASTDANSCGGTDDDDVWFSFVATATTHYVDILNIAGSSTDMYHALYTGTCGSLTELYCSDPNTSTANSLTIGVTYLIRVYTYTSTGSQTSTFDMCITTDPPPVYSCTGNYYDTGGSGSNYSNSEDYIQSYCSDAGDCIEIVFNSFSTESGYDELTIYNGPDITSPIVGIYSGTTSPGTITSLTGCLTFLFDSDGSTTGAGWDISVSCVTCPAASCSDGVLNQDETDIDCGGVCPACPTATTQDCLGGTSICSDATFNDNSNGSGDDVDLDGSNSGCLGTENETSWYFFEAQTAGTLEFLIDPSNGTDDYDFAMWGPYPSGTTPATACPPVGAPIRCSFAAGAPTAYGGTGLQIGAGDVSEGTGGDDIVDEITLVIGDVYVLVVDNYSGTTSPFTMDISLTSGLTLDCVPLPVNLMSFTGLPEDGYNELKWKTATEINNDKFEIEKSLDGVLFSKLDEVQGSGNNSTITDYNYQDKYPASGITYYRLRQVDFDGKFQYSNVIAVKQSAGSEVSLFPNPTAGKMNLNFVSKEADNYTVTISDIFKVIEKESFYIEKGNHVKRINSFLNITNGIYFIKIEDSLGNTITHQKIVKN
ncbi:T9SS type A sorting domain-containing protein [Vicingaceae bacterium]|nr:T9SS type A sorting domain-containing protein [Vicingaceae bacterium]